MKQQRYMTKRKQLEERVVDKGKLYYNRRNIRFGIIAIVTKVIEYTMQRGND